MNEAATSSLHEPTKVDADSIGFNDDYDIGYDVSCDMI